MNTAEVAEALGTTARTLRQFLRSPESTYCSVGSGARYVFKESDLPTLRKRFAEWQGSGKSKPSSNAPARPRRTRRTPEEIQNEKDRLVWEEEGPIVVPDIRDPRVRARVKADAEAAEERLMVKLLAVGLHITQLGDRK